jgi:hypothetical protein
MKELTPIFHSVALIVGNNPANSILQMRDIVANPPENAMYRICF